MCFTIDGCLKPLLLSEEVLAFLHPRRLQLRILLSPMSHSRQDNGFDSQKGNQQSRPFKSAGLGATGAQGEVPALECIANIRSEHWRKLMGKGLHPAQYLGLLRRALTSWTRLGFLPLAPLPSIPWQTVHRPATYPARAGGCRPSVPASLCWKDPADQQAIRDLDHIRLQVTTVSRHTTSIYFPRHDGRMRRFLAN